MSRVFANDSTRTDTTPQSLSTLMSTTTTTRLPTTTTTTTIDDGDDAWTTTRTTTTTAMHDSDNDYTVTQQLWRLQRQWTTTTSKIAQMRQGRGLTRFETVYMYVFFFLFFFTILTFISQGRLLYIYIVYTYCSNIRSSMCSSSKLVVSHLEIS